MKNPYLAKKNNQTHWFCILLGLLSVIIDQASKIIAVNYLDLHIPVCIFPFLNFTLTFNTGISFGMLNTHDSTLLITVSIICLILIIWAYLGFKDAIERIFLTLVIGGAIGNLIDRFIHKAVIDFIDFCIPNSTWHFPTFNVADIFVTVGASCLVLYNLFKKHAIS